MTHPSHPDKTRISRVAHLASLIYDKAVNSLAAEMVSLAAEISVIEVVDYTHRLRYALNTIIYLLFINNHLKLHLHINVMPMQAHFATPSDSHVRCISQSSVDDDDDNL